MYTTGKYCESVNCPWYKGRCTSPNDHTKKPNGEIECDYDRGITPFEETENADWIYGEDKYGQDGWTCNKCRFFIPWYYKYYESPNFISNYHFCPRCGAEMKSYTGKVET